MVISGRKKALHKDFFMEIRKNKARFISIFCIVALGVAFFSGIQASSPDMRYSGDAYYTESRLMDLKVIGTLGLTEDDVSAVKAVDGVETAEGSYFVDVTSGEGEKQKVLHIEALNDEVNLLTVSEGRLPEKSGECFLDATFAAAQEYEVGDEITFTEAEDSKMLGETTYTIVGTGKSPLYISFNRGNTTIGSGEVNGFAFILKEDFDSEVFTQIYIRAHGTDRVTSYTDAYDRLVEKVQKRLEDIEEERCEIRYESVVSDANEKIEEAREEYEEGKNEEEEELEDARTELQNGEKELKEGKEEYKDGLKQFLSAKREIYDGKQTIAEKKQELESGKQELIDGKAQIEAGEAKLSAAKQELANGKAQLKAGQKQLNEEGWAVYNSGKSELEEKEKELTSGKSQVQAGISTCETSIEQCNTALSVLPSKITEIENGIVQAEEGVNQAQAGVTSAEEAVNAAQDRYDQASEEEKDACTEKLQEARTALDAANSALNQSQAALTALTDTKSELESQLAKAEAGLKEAQETKQQLEQSLSSIEAGEKELAAAKVQLDASYQTLSEKQAEIDANQKTIEAGEAEIAANEQTLAQSKAKISEAEAQIASGETEITKYERQLTDGEKELKESADKLNDAKQDILDGEKELEDGWSEYREGYEEAQEKFADAEAEINDAVDDVNAIEQPEWMITDRNDLPEYSDYGDNADRIKNIGEVFPVIFFLVAALISLTTMTRMVEEQRTQIGTLKALGYGKLSIASKYLSYAFLATMGGSIIGILIGEKILPFIIIKSYGIMYNNVSILKIHYEFRYALTASIAAVVCTVGATVFSCSRTLAETPASLMRPPAPKEGKRILLERIPFIWKHLNFTWKSSMRNLFRYKKRLLMTIFGIAGSMGLMLVGYGIKDSISDIVRLQYSDLQHYDGTIVADEDASAGEQEELKEGLQKEESIERFTYIQLSKVTAPRDKSSLSIYLYVPENLDNFKEDVTLRNRETHEEYELTDEGAAVSEKTANLLGLETGDTMTIKKDDKEYQVKVAVITENYAGHYVYMTPAVYRETFDEEPVYEDVVFTLKEKYQDQMEETGQKIMESPAVLSISYTSSIVDQVDRMLSTLGIVIVVLIVSAGLLAFVVLYNLNNINITERQRELATLKVLGFFDLEVSQYVLRENILLTIAGILFGSVFGIILHRYIIVTVEVDAVMFGRNIRPVSFLYCAVLTALFSIVVNVFMHRKLKKIDMVESLKSVE